MELLSLQSTHPDKRRTSPQKIVSIALHILLLAAITLQIHPATKPPPKKLIALKIIPYAPGHTAIVRPPKPKILPPKDPPKLVLAKPEPPPPSSGGDPNGEADVTIAMADFYPPPQPDLALLPHGTKGDIVLNVIIGEDGKVVETHIDQGLGHGIDEAVQAVIQTWTFTPATKAGKPVASEQQLLFHFERA